MLGPINTLNVFPTTALQPVVELTREGVQAAQPVQAAQATQPVQPAPAAQTGSPVFNRQQGNGNTGNQQAATQQAQSAAPTAGQRQTGKPETRNDPSQAKKPAETSGQSKTGLTPQEKALLDELIQSDHRVRAHEQAHIAAGGNLVRGGPNFEYNTGPDKQRYAVGGEVSIDTTPVDGDPAATIRKAEHIRRAALAPVDPSSQDLRVAAEATQMEQQAQAEERQATLDKTKQATGDGAATAKQQKTTSPVLEAMLKKAYETALGKTPNAAGKPVLGSISA